RRETIEGGRKRSEARELEKREILSSKAVVGKSLFYSVPVCERCPLSNDFPATASCEDSHDSRRFRRFSHGVARLTRVLAAASHDFSWALYMRSIIRTRGK